MYIHAAAVADALKRTSDRVALAGGKNFQKPTLDYGLQGAPPCFVTCDANNQDRFYDCANCPYMRAVPTGSGTLGSPPTETGRGKDEPLQRFLGGIPSGRYEPASGQATLSGIAVETDDATGLARRVSPVRLGGRLEEARPAFW